MKVFLVVLALVLAINSHVVSSRKLDAVQDFMDRCDATSNGKGYVDCNGGYAVVNGVTTNQTCAEACGNTRVSNTNFGGGIWSGGDCCTGEDACGRISIDGTIQGGFTGKG